MWKLGVSGLRAMTEKKGVESKGWDFSAFTGSPALAAIIGKKGVENKGAGFFNWPRTSITRNWKQKVGDGCGK